MISTFHGLEVAKRGMSTQQAALYVTGHNIANANTPGYSRQRVNFATTNPFPSPSMNRPQIPGQMGTGVQATDIQRIRDSFIDMQYQTENSKLGYWQAKSEMLSQMENIMNEPSDTGISSVMDEFWNAFQDLAVQPQNDGARRVARERGISLANTINYTYDSLKAIQQDYRKEIDVNQDRINSLLRQINQLNKQIGSIEPHGYLPNDLYDERDNLVDELSTLVSIKIEKKPSGGYEDAAQTIPKKTLASANAEGLYDIYLATPSGSAMQDSSNPSKPIKLIDSLGAGGTAYGIKINYEPPNNTDSPVTNISFHKLKENDSGFEDNTSVYNIAQLSAFNTNGKLKGFIEGYGYKFNATSNDLTATDTEVRGTYNQMLDDLDQMTYTFANHFNEVHNSGWSLKEIRAGQKSTLNNFFDLGGAGASDFKGIAGKIKVAESILSDVSNIAAAAEGNILAGAFTRVPDPDASINTIGNPIFTGTFNPAVGWENVKKVELNVKYEDGEWKYQIIGENEDRSEIAHPSSTTFESLEAGKETVEKFGVKIDISKVSKKPEGAAWQASFTTAEINASDKAFVGNGSNALKLANVKDAMLDYGVTKTNVSTFYQGMIGKLGDSASEANRMTYTSEVLKSSVEERRMSMSSVSLDEEMTNMIKFQHAYNAAARNITLVDEMLDKIINGMGVVGR